MGQKSQENAVERLRRRINDRIEADKDKPAGYRRTQAKLAEACDIAESSLSELLSGPAASRGLLAHLDKIAKYFGVPPSLLVHKNDTALMELEQGEYRLIQHWRTFPPAVQEQVMMLFDYFSGFLPEEKEERRLWQRWRRLSANGRQRLENLLEDTLKAEQLAKRATRDQPAAEGRTAGSPEPARISRRQRP